MVDLSAITSNKMAVRCRTAEQAGDFVSHVWQVQPGACVHWTPGETQWDIYQEDTCYSLFDEGEGVMLCFSPDCEYRNDGFKVIDFENAVFELTDLGDLDADSIELSILYGTEVQDAD